MGQYQVGPKWIRLIRFTTPTLNNKTMKEFFHQIKPIVDEYVDGIFEGLLSEYVVVISVIKRKF